MKNVMIAAALILFGFQANAKTTKTKSVFIKSTAIDHFKEKFGEEVDASWSNPREDLYRADFELNNEKLTAFYNEDGNYVATTRDITLEQLPLNLKLEVNKKLKDYTFIQAFEMTGESDGWYIEVTNPKYKIIWKGQSDGSITVFSKKKVE